MGATRVRMREVSVEVPAGYVPRSTLLPPPPDELPSWHAPAPLTPLIDAVGHVFTMEMDWSDRANDDDVGASGRHRIVSLGDEDRPTLPSPGV